jgi:threonine dehydratase
VYVHVQIIGVEPTGANAMAQSLARGERVALSRVDAFADGVAVKQVGLWSLVEKTCMVWHVCVSFVG